jgi:TatD DNase family protein
MIWVDSHCHLNLIDLDLYNNDPKNLIQSARAKQVKYIMCVGVDIKTTPSVLSFADNFECVYASVGIHPSDVNECVFDVQWFSTHANQKNVIAIGETGLDYHYPNVSKKTQQVFFRKQIEWAIKLKKPLIIHSRDSADDTMRILRTTHASDVGGVLHCFTGDLSMAEEAIDMGFYIGISGIVTFKNAKVLQDVVKKTPLEHLLLETDAPWLAPTPYRGKPNTPEYIPFIGEAVANLKNISIEAVAKQTTDNFLKLFSLI